MVSARLPRGRGLRRAGVALLAGACLAFALSGAQLGVHAAGGLTYSLSIVGAYGGEPSFISDPHGVLYDTTPSGLCTSACNTSSETDVVPIYRSTDKGATWTRIQEAETVSGDDCFGMDQGNSLYWCNLAGSQGHAPLQADNWKSTSAATCTTNCNWIHGSGAVPGGQCGTSCSIFGVDRDWTAATIPPGKTTDGAEVVLMYHDFYGATQIWVNISQDGGRSYGAPQEVLASPAVTPGAVSGSLVAEGYTFCNTVPAGVTIVPPGKPHAGRITVGWIAADVPQDATGCNITMLQSFHTAWVSYSDDNGASWTAQQVIDMGFGRDMSTPFVAMTQDPDGNVYFAYASQPQGSVAATEQCAAESAAGTEQGDPACAYNMYVVWSNDGGATWDGGGGLIPGSAATPYQVNPPGDGGTHFFPAIAAAAPGKVDVAYIHTPTVIPTDAFGKANPGGCAGPSVAGVPTYPATCDWYLHAAQSLNLTAGPSGATWTNAQLTPHPMHYGDVCNLGIFCIPNVSNRHLLDFMQMAIDPTTGCAHIGYADDNADTLADPQNPSPYGNHLVAANQTNGCIQAASTTTTPVPTPSSAGGVVTPNTGATVPWAPALPLLAILVLGGLLAFGRRRGARS